MSGIAKLFERIDYLTVLFMLFPLVLFLGLSLLGLAQLLALVTAATVFFTACKLARWAMARREAWRIQQARRRLIARWKSYKEIGNN